MPLCRQKKNQSFAAHPECLATIHGRATSSPCFLAATVSMLRSRPVQMELDWNSRGWFKIVYKMELFLQAVACRLMTPTSTHQFSFPEREQRSGLTFLKWFCVFSFFFCEGSLAWAKCGSLASRWTWDVTLHCLETFSPSANMLHSCCWRWHWRLTQVHAVDH